MKVADIKCEYKRLNVLYWCDNEGNTDFTKRCYYGYCPIRETIEMQEKDKCVGCGCETEYDVNEHIDNRMFYVEGAGQLCKKCWDKVYNN